MSKLIPILYQPDMVRAKLELRKNQTRRLLKHPSANAASGYAFAPLTNTWHPMDDEGEVYFEIAIEPKYGLAGDILWTRENFYALGKWVKNGTTKTGKQKWKFEDMTLQMGRKYLYPYGSEKPATVEKKKDGLIHWYSRNSLFMPFEACRLFDKVTAIRIERLHDITEADAIAEGILFYDSEILGRRFKDYVADSKFYGHPVHDYPSVSTAIESYFSLWISINGEESYKANPFVWVIEFEPTTKPTNL